MNEKEVVEQEMAEKADLVLGKTIIKAREAKGLSQADLAARLNLHETTIEFLEGEHFKELPAPAFVRGYIRVIGAELHLDVDELLHVYAGYDQLEPNLASISLGEKQRKASVLVMVWGTVVILLVVLIIWGVLGRSENIEGSVAEGNIIEVLPTTLSDIQLNVNSKVPSAGIETSLELIDHRLVLAPEANVVELKGRGILTIRVNGPTWADIRDARGFRLVYDLLDKSDEPRRVTGWLPFSVFLGDAKQVELRFQGKDFDFSRYVRVNNVARFSIK